MRNLKELLNPDDSAIINETSGINWVPKNPAEILLPYRESEEELSEVDEKRAKAKEIIENYTKIINNCNELEAIINQRCKSVSVPLSPKNNLRIIESMKRVFGTNTTEITFEHYKRCIEALADINNTLPKAI